MENCYPCALTIAGSDSGGGAGIQADLKTFSALGVYGASVITAVTAQNTVGVRAVHEVPVDIVCVQLDAVLEDLPINAVKIGMLSSAEIIHAVAERLVAHHVKIIVLDTVMLAKDGNALLRDAAIETLITELIPLATIITPNLPEAACLLHVPAVAQADTEIAAALLALGPRAVLLKGGHSNEEVITDLLFTVESPHVTLYQHPRIHTAHTHGTGCTLSSAIAAGLAQGLSIPVATEAAITWLQGAITHAWPLGHGHGPVHHFWQLWPVCDK